MPSDLNTFTSRSHILTRLKQANQHEVSEIFSHADDTDQNTDKVLSSSSPIFDWFYEEGGSTPIKSVCNFTVSEFQKSWMNLSDHISKHLNVGKGREFALTGNDLFLFLMSSVLLIQQWDFTEPLFKTAPSTLGIQMTKYLQIMCSSLFVKHIIQCEKKWTPRKLIMLPEHLNIFPTHATPRISFFSSLAVRLEICMK